MLNDALLVMTVAGSLHARASTRALLVHCGQLLRQAGCAVDSLDLASDPLELFNPDESHQRPEFPALQRRVAAADVFLLGTPDYHGCMSGVMKNFLDHFWKEFAGKLFVPVVASHEKGLTVADQIRTAARQCYAWSLPYAVSFMEGQDFKDGAIVSESFGQRVAMLVRDVNVYGELLARQRQRDLTGTGAGFMARYRSQS